MELLLVSWGVAIVVGGLIGNNKGRTAEGILLSIFLTWLGVIIIALMKPSHSVQVQRAADQLDIQQQAQMLAIQRQVNAPDCTRCGRPAAEHGQVGQCPQPYFARG